MQSWFNESEAIEKIWSATDGRSFYWKYVRINEKYLFADAASPCSPPHKSAVKEGEKPESAAFVKIGVGSSELEVQVAGWSMTLNIGPSKDDESRLTQLLVFEASAIPGHDPDCYGRENCECKGEE